MSKVTEGSSYYIIIPGSVRLDKNISADAKLLYGEVAVKCSMTGFCWATNKFLADITGCAVRSIQRYIRELEDNGHIVTVLDCSGGNRKIFVKEVTTNLARIGVPSLAVACDIVDTASSDTDVIQTNKNLLLKENKKRTPDGGGATDLFNLENEFKKIDKTKTAVWEFIKQHRPTFIEPYHMLWNIFATERKLPKVETLNDSRKRKFNVRIKEKAFNFLMVLKKASTSQFLLTGGWFGFDWIIDNDKNYLKVIEGNYDNTKSAAVKKDPIHSTASTKNDESFGVTLLYLKQKYIAGTLDDDSIKPDLYDKLVTHNYLSVGTLKNYQAKTIDQQKILAIKDYLASQKQIT